MTRRSIYRWNGPAQTRRQDGFAMVEIVIAFTVLALGIGAILVGVATAARSDARAHNSRAMHRIAQAHLEAAGVADKLVIGRREGRAGQFKWNETVVPATIGGDKKKDKSSPGADGMVAPVWVEIAVRAADGSEEKLSALKLIPRVGQ